MVADMGSRDSTRSIFLFHVRLTCLINLLITRVFDDPLEYPFIHYSRRLERPRDEEVSAARPGAQHKWPVGLVRPHQLAGSAYAVVCRVPSLLLLVRVEQVLEPVPE